MLSSAVIIFREVFEIVLIVGIVLAATKHIPNRMKAIYLGFGAGLLGSAIVATFTGVISDMAEGLGQEFFNAGILFTAAGFIGWTLLWMKKHAKDMKRHFAEIGQSVAIGRTPMVTLSAVIALAIVREGSEIALFSYGMLASGQSASSLLTGGAIGLVGGATVGILLYLGLIKLSPKVFLQTTSWLLVLLVAGMMSQGMGFLTQAGLFETMSYTMWDSSHLLSERGIIGESMKALVGYTAQPTAIQLTIYLLTIGTLTMLMKLNNNPSQQTSASKTAALMLLGLAAFVLPTQSAQAGKKVYTPYVEMGELELESRTEYNVDDDSDVDGAWEQSIGLGYGVNEFWFTEVYGEWEKEGDSGADVEFTNIEWENRFQLTQPGEYFLDFGVLTELKFNMQDGANKAELKGLVAKDTGDFSHAANIIVEREFGEDSSDDTEAGFAWSTKYRYMPEFEPGIEMYNDFGEINDSSDFDDEKHRLGPVAYGKIGQFGYDVGYLFGLSDAAPDGTLKVNLEYEF